MVMQEIHAYTTHGCYHEACKSWVILCKNCEDCFIHLQVPSIKRGIVKCAYLHVCFFKTVLVNQMQ